MAQHETCLPASREAPRSARLFLREALASRHLDGVGTTAEMLTTELVSNVVCHVGSTATVRLITDGPVIRVEVDDASAVPPVLQAQDAEEPSGNGLRLVDALATRWGTDLSPGGKTVWFELHTQRAARPPSE
jgi:serine/threonine-protein kinase RsbW